jgi:peptidyl-prolyl cis-trans isomerase D
MFQPPGQVATRPFFLPPRGFFMLDQLRQGAQGWVSKVLMVLLVLSFAVWGIGGFSGYGAGTLATVGDTQVSVQDFARVYDQAQRNAQQAGRQVNPEQVLSQLLMNAALDDAASDFKLGVSDDRVAAEIAKNPAFQRPDGSFDRERFLVLLANAGIDRDAFVHDVRRELVRGQIAESLSAGLSVPEPLVAALYRLQNEERTLSYVVVDGTAITPVGAPGETELQAYFEENKERFRAPEYRKIAFLSLDPGAIADPASVTEDDVSTEYERRKPSLTQPERRRVEQIRFADAAAAQAAMAKIDGGETFPAAATASGTEVTDLGVKTKAEILDPIVAEAAFSAALNTPVAVIEGALEPSIILVTNIEPQSVPSLQEIAPQIRSDLARRVALDHMQELYDQVEDERAGGSTLQEAAAKLSLPYRVIDAVSADLKAPDGSAVADIPSASALIKDAFESEVGDETSPIRGESDSWVFYDLLDTIPARDRTLDEVRAEVVTAWTEAETASRIAARADELFARLKSGVPLATIATEIGKTVTTVESVKRNTPPEGLTANAVSQAFAGPDGHIANAEGAGQARVLLKVEKVVAPAFFAEASDAMAIQSQLSTALRNDLIATYNRQLLESRSASVNNVAYQQLTGQAQTQ